jgi:hypothetical protein
MSLQNKKASSSGHHHHPLLILFLTFSFGGSFKQLPFASSSSPFGFCVVTHGFLVRVWVSEHGESQRITPYIKKSFYKNITTVQVCGKLIKWIVGLS